MFRQTLYVAVAGALAAGTVQLVVRAQPPSAAFSISDAVDQEGQSGNVHVLTFRVTLANPPVTEARVRFIATRGSAVPDVFRLFNSADFTIPASGSSGNPAGAPASLYPNHFSVAGVISPAANVSIELGSFSHAFPEDVDVLLVGPGGQKALVLSDVGGQAPVANLFMTFFDHATATVGATLTSGGFRPSVDATLDPFPAPAPEGPYGTSLGVFDLMNPNGVWRLFIVDDLFGDTGSAGYAELTFETGLSDYFTEQGELVFPPGVTSRNVSVWLVGDSQVEPNEQFTVVLSNPVNATIADGVGVGHILNDDGGGPPPTVVNDTFRTPVGTVLSVGAAGVLSNDLSNGGGPLAAVRSPFLSSEPSHGSVVLNSDGSFVYTPQPGFFGSDFFRYELLNTYGSDFGFAIITVGLPPTSVADAFSTAFHTLLAVPAPGVLGNDNPNLAGQLGASLTAAPAHGAVSLNSDGSFVYTPASGFHGTDSFTYQAYNALDYGPVTTVTLSVGPPPTAAGDTFATAFQMSLSVAAPGVLGNDDSHGGGALTATLLSSTSHGTLALAANGGFTYTPQSGFTGTDSFTYRAGANGPGGSATVTITVDEPTTVQPPTNLYVSAMTGNAVTLRVTPPAIGPDATGYVLEGGLNPGDVLASLATGSDAPIFTLAAPSGSFYVRMHALSGAQKSGPSNEIRIHVNVPVTPSAPDRFSSTVNGNRLALSWRNTFAGGPPTGLVLAVSGDATAQLPLGGNAESMSIATAPGGTYTLSLRAQNGGGSSAAAPPITVTIPDACPGPPAPPAAFLLYRLGNTAFAVWEPAASGPAAESFILSVSGSFEGSFATATRGLSGHVGPGSYTVTVTAANSCGTSPPTSPQTIVVP